MPYNARAQYLPALFVRNIIAATPVSHPDISYLRALEAKIESAVISPPSPPSQPALSVSHAHANANYVSFYANVALGRTLREVFDIWNQICARSGVERGVLWKCLEERVRVVEGAFRAFRGGGGEGEEGVGEEMRAHIKSIEICVGGLKGWVEILGMDMDM